MLAALPRAIALALALLPGAASAQALACPAETACRNDACAPAAGDLGARVVPLGADGVGLAADGPVRAVESISRGEGPDMIVTWFTPDAAEMIAVRAGDLAFTYRRRTPEGWLILRGACKPE